MKPNDAYTVAVDWYERTNTLQEALDLVEHKRSEIWRPNDVTFLNTVEYHIRQFWSSGIKHKVYRPSAVRT
jgi:hypothetical protein